MRISKTTNMPNGLTNAAPWQTMGMAGVPDPTWAQIYHNDFNVFIATDLTASLTGIGTIVLTATDGGAVVITTGAGATDANSYQVPVAGFKLTPGKKAFFKASMTLDSVTLSTVFAGLIITSATPNSAANGLFIRKAAGSSLLYLVHRVGSVETATAFPAAAIPVAATQFEVGFAVDELGTVTGFFNPTTGGDALLTNPSGFVRGPVVQMTGVTLTTALLAPTYGQINSSAVARATTLDYLVAVRER